MYFVTRQAAKWLENDAALNEILLWSHDGDLHNNLFYSSGLHPDAEEPKLPHQMSFWGKQVGDE